MIGCFNCPGTGIRLQPTVRLQLYRMISKKNEGANAPIIFEEFVMVMINNGNRTEWSTIRSEIIRVINKIGLP